MHDEARLMARVARMYYEDDQKQSDIADRLGLSQAKVSRLLKQAIDEDIVRITVRTPPGVQFELESAIERRFGLVEAIVVETSAVDEQQMMRDLGRAAAFLLETSIRSGEVVGISAWSSTLLATVDAMRPVSSARGVRVVQMLGGVGSPSAEGHATLLTRRLADVLQGEPVLLPVPGVVGSPNARRVLEQDAHVQAALELLPRVTLALVGIGAIEPSPMLALSGNIFSTTELADVAGAGAVGDICLRFFDANGRAVRNKLDQRVIGLSLDQLRLLPRAIAVAGGARKRAAISAALRGGLVRHLVTDAATARLLLADPVPSE